MFGRIIWASWKLVQDRYHNVEKVIRLLENMLNHETWLLLFNILTTQTHQKKISIISGVYNVKKEFAP